MSDQDKGLPPAHSLRESLDKAMQEIRERHQRAGDATDPEAARLLRTARIGILRSIIFSNERGFIDVYGALSMVLFAFAATMFYILFTTIGQYLNRALPY